MLGSDTARTGAIDAGAGGDTSCDFKDLASCEDVCLGDANKHALDPPVADAGTAKAACLARAGSRWDSGAGSCLQLRGVVIAAYTYDSTRDGQAGRFDTRYVPLPEGLTSSSCMQGCASD